jgi:hypothetical protein
MVPADYMLLELFCTVLYWACDDSLIISGLGKLGFATNNVSKDRSIPDIDPKVPIEKGGLYISTTVVVCDD